MDEGVIRLNLFYKTPGFSITVNICMESSACRSEKLAKLRPHSDPFRTSTTSFFITRRVSTGPVNDR